jgi:alkylhydroperoxidase family enzyme
MRIMVPGTVDRGTSPSTPRIAPVRPDELTDEQRELLSAASPDGQPRTSEFFSILVRHPALYRRWSQYGWRMLRKGVLSDRDRELAILRTAWLCKGDYEWGQHVAAASRVGMTPAEIEAVIAGASDTTWSPDEAAVLAAVDELHRDSCISEATWDALVGRLDERQLLELPMLVGFYTTIAWLQRTLEVALPEGSRGLDAR